MRRELNSSGSDYGKKKKLTWILKCMSYLVMECLNLITYLVSIIITRGEGGEGVPFYVR